MLGFALQELYYYYYYDLYKRDGIRHVSFPISLEILRFLTHRYSMSARCPRPPRVLPGRERCLWRAPARCRVPARVDPDGMAAAGVPAP